MIPALKDLLYEKRLQRQSADPFIQRLRGDMIQVYKITHGLNDMDRNTLFTMKDVETDLRGHNMRIHKEYAHLNIR